MSSSPVSDQLSPTASSDRSDESDHADAIHSLLDTEALDSELSDYVSDDLGSVCGYNENDCSGQDVVSNQTFTSFLLLPFELRMCVWQHLSPDLAWQPRVLDFCLFGPSPIYCMAGPFLSHSTSSVRHMFAVHRESRAIAQTLFPDELKFENASAVLRFDNRRDVIKILISDIVARVEITENMKFGLEGPIINLAFDASTKGLMPGNGFITDYSRMPGVHIASFLTCFPLVQYAFWVIEHATADVIKYQSWCGSKYARQYQVMAHVGKPSFVSTYSYDMFWPSLEDENDKRDFIENSRMELLLDTLGPLGTSGLLNSWPKHGRHKWAAEEARLSKIELYPMLAFHGNEGLDPLSSSNRDPELESGDSSSSEEEDYEEDGFVVDDSSPLTPGGDGSSDLSEDEDGSLGIGEDSDTTDGRREDEVERAPGNEDEDGMSDTSSPHHSSSTTDSESTVIAKPAISVGAQRRSPKSGRGNPGGRRGHAILLDSDDSSSS